jgi:hypothetical protein
MKAAAAVVICAVLTIGAAAPAHPQEPVRSTGKSGRAANSLIHCTADDRASRHPKPCGSGGPAGKVQYASDFSRQELECVVLGVCGSTDRGT